MIDYYNPRFTFDIILFEKCNLKCRHCYQHNPAGEINWDETALIPDAVYNTLISALKRRSFTNVTIGLNGGEMFIDAFPDAYFDNYRQLVYDISDRVVNRLGLQLSIEFVTNCTFTNRNRVDQLLKDTKTFIGTSYDPIGRYSSDRQKQTAIDNIKYYHDLGLVHDIGIMLTKPNINYYLEHDDLETFRGMNVEICYFIPSAIGTEDLIPSDNDLWNFWKMCHDRNYTFIHAYNAFIENVNYNRHNIFCKCDNGAVIRHGKAFLDCSVYASDYKPINFYKTKLLNDDNIARVRLAEGYNKRGCLSCDFINICPQYCWSSILHNAVKLTDKCPHKRLIQLLIDEKNNSDNSVLQKASKI